MSDTRRAPDVPDDWDWIESLTRRVGRWMLVGLLSWVILLALLNERLTGLPLEIGFVMASVLAFVVIVVDDLRRRGARRGAMTPFMRALLVWVAAFLVLAIVSSRAGADGVALVLVPFVGASVVAALIELIRRVMQEQRT